MPDVRRHTRSCLCFFGNRVLRCWINTTEMLSQSGFHHLKEAHCCLSGIILPNEASPPVVQICRLVLPVTKDDLGGVSWRRLLTGTCLPAGDCDLPCPRSLPAIPCSLDQSSGASWFLPLWQSWDSEACLLRCIMAAASVHLQHLAERSCSSGGCVASVEAVWVFYSRADLLMNSEEGASIWKRHYIRIRHLQEPWLTSWIISVHDLLHEIV